MPRKKPQSHTIIPTESITEKILLICGQKVMLDTDLAGLYAVQTKVLNRAVKRNLDRFPADFMFQLTAEEAEGFEVPLWHLKLEVYRLVPLKECSWWTPLSTLCLHRAGRRDAFQRSAEYARRSGQHRHHAGLRPAPPAPFHQQAPGPQTSGPGAQVRAHDSQIQAIFAAIRKLMEPPPVPPSRQIGFVAPEEK